MLPLHSSGDLWCASTRGRGLFSSFGVMEGILFHARKQQLAEFFLYMWKELELTVSAGKDYRLALSHVFIQPGMDIASDR